MLEFPCLVVGQFQVYDPSRDALRTNIGPIRRWSVVFIVLSDFVEVILVQLSNETSEITVLEMFRQYILRELFVLQVVKSA